MATLTVMTVLVMLVSASVSLIRCLRTIKMKQATTVVRTNDIIVITFSVWQQNSRHIMIKLSLRVLVTKLIPRQLVLRAGAIALIDVTLSASGRVLNPRIRVRPPVLLVANRLSTRVCLLPTGRRKNGEEIISLLSMTLNRPRGEGRSIRWPETLESVRVLLLLNLRPMI